MGKITASIRCAGFILAISAGPLFADVVSFTGLPADFEDGTYNGFTSGTIDGVPFNDLICDDYAHTTIVPSSNLIFNVSTLDTLQYARFANHPSPSAADISNYEAAAILVQGLIDHPGQVADYQYALWDLFTPDTPSPGQAGVLLANALGAVQGDVSGYADLFSKLRIYTPAGDFASNQEFLQIDPPPAVPEPTSLILLSTAAAIVLGRKRFRSPGRAA